MAGDRTQVLAIFGNEAAADNSAAALLPADSRPGRPTIDPDLHEVAHRVHEEFDDHVDPSVVDECLNQVAARFDGATVRSFIPLLVRRYVREELLTRLRQA